jgi:hypothetical protein
MNPATDWIDQARGLLDLLKQGLTQDTAAPAGDAEHAGDCRWCPVCQAAAVVRGERPEVTAALADVLTSAAAALRTLAEADRPAAPDAAGGPAAGGPAGEPGDSPPVVQRIEIA